MNAYHHPGQKSTYGLWFFLQWPILLTRLMPPVLIVLCVRLARREEREPLAGFGDVYRACMARSPAFVPKLREPRRT